MLYSSKTSDLCGLNILIRMDTEKRLCFQLIGAQFVILNNLDILFIEADGQVCHLNLISGVKITAVRHLGYYKDGLINNFGFWEISKSILVNAAHVTRYESRERTIHLFMGGLLPVSKSRQEYLNKHFKELHESWGQDFTDF